MHVVNAVALIRMAMRNVDMSSMMMMMIAAAAAEFRLGSIPFESAIWFIYTRISCFLNLFAGKMSGLTLGLMSRSLVELEILQHSSTSSNGFWDAKEMEECVNGVLWYFRESNE
ncbi:hypothetical protein LguiB_015859 [Lonicera macranthoides]